MAFLDTLSKRARTAFPFVRRGVREGLSSNSILRSLAASGLGVNRATGLSLIRQVRDHQDAETRLRFLGMDRRPNPRRLPEALTPIRRLFSFTVEIRGVNTDTGLFERRLVTVSTDDLKTRRELEEIAEGIIDADKPRYGLEVDSVQLQGGLKAAEGGLL